MGSGNSRNAVVSAAPKDENIKRRTGVPRMFQSRCFGSFPDYPDNALNSMIQDGNCGRSAVPVTIAQVQGGGNPGRRLNTGSVTSPETCDLYDSASFMDYSERSRRHFKPVSDPSSSSMQDRITPEPEPSTSFQNGSLKRGKATKHYKSRHCFNLPSSIAEHSSVQLKRTTSLGSSEAYSVFERKLRRYCSNADMNKGVGVGHSSICTAAQTMQENRLHVASETGLGPRRVHSMRMRPSQYANLPFNASGRRDTSSESVSTRQTTYVGSGQGMGSNSGQIVSILRRSSSITLASREARQIRGRYGINEHVQGNPGFRRTQSVGQLQDRVFRGTSPECLLGMLERDAMDRETRWRDERRLCDALTRSSLRRQVEIPAIAGQNQFLCSSRSMNGNRVQRDERHQMNEDLLINRGIFVEQSSIFLEERRRLARSQVRRLQRLRDGFENFAGHDRSCILAGNYYIGHCTCQTIGRPNQSNTRASISRLIMLAEALFEVLDEIHNQSISLPSQSSAVAVRSFPAPDHVVESMPVLIYKEHEIVQSEEAAQCYICLMEYEEGDRVKVLPCHHEFHKICIDKWLKEIHRVCPLCRGNICDASPANQIRTT